MGNKKMGKKIKRFTPFIILVVGSLVFVVFFGYYFFYYVPGQKISLTNRYLRVLAMMSDQFENRGTNFPKQIEIPIDNQNPSGASYSDPKDSIIERTKKVLIANYKSYFQNTDPKPEFPVEGISSFYNSSQQAFKFPVQVKSLKTGVGNPIDYGIINIPVKVDDFIQELSCGEEFDDVMIIDDHGAVICMRNQIMKKGIVSGTKALNIKGSLNDRGSKTESTPYVTRLLDMNIAGLDHKLFIQPIPLEFLSPKLAGNSTKNPIHWRIAGVVLADTFSRRCREIPINYLLVLILFIVMAFIAYPLVRLMLIGAWERIRARDVFFLILSLAIGIPIIVFSILSFSHYQMTKINVERDFESLAYSIHDRFTDEIKTAREQLRFFEGDGLSLLQKDNSEKKESAQNLLDSLLKRDQCIIYPYFDMIFSVDDKGEPYYKGVADNSTVFFKNVSSRNYFKMIQKKDYWYTLDNKPMVLEPVHSLSTVRYELNLAIPSNDPDYVATVMSFRPLSVLNPLLPSDYGFAIIDQEGRVIFHSDHRLNLNENFFSECSDANPIKAAIYNKAHDYFTTMYQGKKQNIFIKPIKNIPWTLIVFRNQVINDSIILETLSRAIVWYGYCLIILMVLLLLYVFLIFILKTVSKLQNKIFYHQEGWIWPHQDVQFEYTCLAFFNLLCFALMAIFTVSGKIPYKLFLFVPLLNLLLAYFVIQYALADRWKNDRKNEGENTRHFLLKVLKNNIVPIVILLVVGVLVFFSRIELFNHNAEISTLIKVLILFFFIAFYLVLNVVIGEVKKNKNYFFHRYSHIILLYSFLLLLFINPVLMVDKITQNEKGIVDVKYHQLKYACDYSKWTNLINREYKFQEEAIVKNFCLRAKKVFATKWGTYMIPSYQTLILGEHIIKIIKNPEQNRNTAITGNRSSEEPDPSVTLAESIPNNSVTEIKKVMASGKNYLLISSSLLKKISDIIPFDSSYTEKIKYLYMDFFWEQKEREAKKQSLKESMEQPYDLDYPHKWGVLKSERTGNREVLFLEYLDRPNLGYCIEQKLVEPVYFLSRPQMVEAAENRLWLWASILGIISFIIVLFNIVYFIWKAIFLGNLGTASKETSYIVNTVDEIKKLEGRFFIFGTAPEQVKELAESDDWLVIHCWEDNNLKSICKKLSGKKKSILITHFDYMRHDAKVNGKKLDLLEQAVYGCNVNIVVYSQFEPLGNFNLLDSTVEKKEDKQENGNGNTTSAMKSWERVLKQFDFKYAKEETKSVETPVAVSMPSDLSKHSAALIKDECSSHGYLHPLRASIIKEIERNNGKNISYHMVKDIICEHAKPIYNFIWRTSTREEKLVMTQLAHEGLLNFKNREIIRRLLKRNLIVLSPLGLFNTTFKDYVNAAEDIETTLIWEKIHADSNWTNVRNPLLFILMGVIVFLIISQPNVLNTWLAIIPALTGIIPFLLRLLDQLFSFGIKQG